MKRNIPLIAPSSEESLIEFDISHILMGCDINSSLVCLENISRTKEVLLGFVEGIIIKFISKKENFRDSDEYYQGKTVLLVISFLLKLYIYCS